VAKINLVCARSLHASLWLTSARLVPVPSAVAPDQRQRAAEAACFDVVELGTRGAFFGRKLAVTLQSPVTTVSVPLHVSVGRGRT
jgi:hypothetical protein